MSIDSASVLILRIGHLIGIPKQMDHTRSPQLNESWTLFQTFRFRNLIRKHHAFSVENVVGRSFGQRRPFGVSVTNDVVSSTITFLVTTKAANMPHTTGENGLIGRKVRHSRGSTGPERNLPPRKQFGSVSELRRRRVDLCHRSADDSAATRALTESSCSTQRGPFRKCVMQDSSVVESVCPGHSLCHVSEKEKRLLAQRLTREIFKGRGYLRNRRHLYVATHDKVFHVWFHSRRSCGGIGKTEQGREKGSGRGMGVGTDSDGFRTCVFHSVVVARCSVRHTRSRQQSESRRAWFSTRHTSS